MAKSTDQLSPGDVFAGKYRILELIGEGGGGAVYRAEQESMGRDVALKVLSTQLAEHAEMVERFRREARHVSQLKHPNTITVFDSGHAEGRYYIVMELLEGETLAERIRREGALPLPRALHILDQILRSLAEAHERGLVHRDLKPDNIFLVELYGEPDFVKVLDFGIAKALESEERQLTAHGSVFGTPSYMAPEQARGVEVTASTDVYAVGLILYEMLTGRVAFNGPTLFAILEMQVNAPLPPLPAAVVRSPLAWVIFRACEKLPGDRFADASEFLMEVRRTMTASGSMPALVMPEEAAPPAAAPSVSVSLPAPGVEQATIMLPSLVGQEAAGGSWMTMMGEPPEMVTRWISAGEVGPSRLGGELDGIATLPPLRLDVRSPFPAAPPPELEPGRVLVGQQELAASLERSLLPVLRGEGLRVALVYGVKGVGKTALVGRLFEGLGLEGGCALAAAAPRLEDAPLTALRRLVLEQVAAQPRVEALARQLLRQGGDPQGLRALGVFLDPHEELPDLRHLGVGVLEGVVGRVAQLLAASGTAERPLLVWLDDVQELDEVSLGVIQHLLVDVALERAPLGVVLSARSGLVDGHPELVDAVLRMGWDAGERFASVEVEALDAEGTAGLVAGLAPSGGDVVERVQELSLGVPEVAVATLEHAVAEGRLRWAGGRWRALGEVAAPPAHLAYAGQKLGSLMPQDAPTAHLFLATLEAVSLLMPLAQPQAVRELVRRSGRRVEDSRVGAMLDHLLSVDVVTREVSGAYVIRWPLVDVWLRGALESEGWSAALFEAAASSLRRDNVEADPRVTARVGEHLLAAGKADAGRAELLAAARDALEAGAVGLALRCGVQAWESLEESAWESHPDRFALASTLGVAWLRHGEPDPAGRLLRLVDGARLEEVPPALHGDLQRALGLHAWMKGSTARARAELRRALDWYADHGEPLAEAQTLAVLASLVIQHADGAEAERVRLHAEELAQDPEPEVAAWAALALGRLHREAERLEDARPHLEAAQRRMEGVRDADGAALVALEQALLADASGNLRDAASTLERGTSWALQAWDRCTLARFLATAARMEARRGRPLQAGERLERAWAIAEAIQVPEVTLHVLHATFEVRGMSGDVEEGLPCIQDALRVNRMLDAPQPRVALLLASAAGHIAALHLAGARDALRQLRDAAEHAALPLWAEQESRGLQSLLAAVDQGQPTLATLKVAVRRLPAVASGAILLARRFTEARR